MNWGGERLMNLDEATDRGKDEDVFMGRRQESAGI